MRMDRRAGLLAVGLSFSYTGSYTDEIVTMDGVSCRLLTLISSGILSASAPVTGDLWLCGGGGCGGGATGYGAGGGGSYAASVSNTTFQNVTVTIGAGGVGSYSNPTSGGLSAVSGDVSISAPGGDCGDVAQTEGRYSYYGCGGSGGGRGGGAGGGYVGAGKGDGITKTPFDSAYYVYPYCDGGGGGGYTSGTSSQRRNGGAGGTNGSDGNGITTGGETGGAGGGQYGGAGGKGTTQGTVGSNATGYGSGGGGSGSGNNYAYGGNGYQGVCFIRIPV